MFVFKSFFRYPFELSTKSIHFITKSVNFRIQDSDGGFFERFGSMLHARGEDHDEKFLGTAALPLVDQDAANFEKQSAPAAPVLESRMGEDEDADMGKDSGNESAEADSDSEDKKESMKEIKNALFGMNVSLIKILYNRSIKWFISLWH